MRANSGQQGRELQPVIDDAEEDRREQERAKAKSTKGIDWDTVCAYKTYKVVRIRDRYIGMGYWGIVNAVMLYVVVFAFCIEGKHQQQEPGVGTVLTKVVGKAYSGVDGDNVKVFDPADIRFPVIEPSGAFLLTRKLSVKQTRGTCVDWDNPKKCDNGACGEGETCNGEYCEVANTWCPSLGQHNADNPPPETVIEELKGLEDITLKIMSGIAFPGIGNRFFVTGGSPGATNQFKNITLKALLSLADPPQQLNGKILKNGALIGVSFFWKCDVEAECEPTVVIKKLDSGVGFVQRRARHSRQGGQEVREVLYLHGLRILVDSSGIGKTFSVVLTITQVGSAIALIRVAAMVADYLMLKCFLYDKTRRDTYYKCKVQETEDFSDLQDRINLIHDTKSREVVARPKSGARGGAHVSLGLGAGGRGGLAAAIVSKV